MLYRGGRYELLDGEGLDWRSSTGCASGASTYTPAPPRTVAAVDRGEAEAAFLLRPTPIEDVFEVARRGEVNAAEVPPTSSRS